jgi:molybdate transport system ATP-binding protein
MTGLAADLGLSRGEFTLGAAFSVAPGETVALLGPNGAGKTTAVDAIAGLLALDSGRIELDGRVLDEPNAGIWITPAERDIGVAFQDGALFPHLDAADNVAFGLRARGTDRQEARAIAHEWLERVGMLDLASSRPRQLSGGQRQRVALARALAPEPALVLLDEPFASLDATTRIDTRRLITAVLGDIATPTVLVTHDPVDAFLLADMIHVVEDGAIVQSGTADEIRLRPQTAYAADLVGVNLMRGRADRGRVAVGGFLLSVGDTTASGDVLVTIHPRAISIHRTRPEGSPRNTWETTVVRSEHYGDRVRIQLGVPLGLTAEITPGAEESLGIAESSIVWVSIKATEIDVRAD